MREVTLKIGQGETTASLPTDAVILSPKRCDARALDAPSVASVLESGGLIDAIASARRIALVVNDQTRKGGMRTTLDAIASLLTRAKRPADVDMVVSYGLHARQSDDVSRTIYGDAIQSHVRLLHHDGRDPARLAVLGTLPDGNVVSIAREVLAADLRVLVGAIGFHYYAGFSGGRKAILPGVADEASIVRNHLRVLDPAGPNGRAAGCGPARLDGNPVSEEMFAAARLLDSKGTTFLANAIVGGADVVDFVCGADHEAAFRDGCARLVARNAVVVSREQPLDALVASAGGWPYDASLYQAHKAYDNAYRALGPAIERGDRPPLVFVARCDEGLGHPRFGAWLRHPTREAHYQALRAAYEIVGQTSLAVRDKAALTRTIAVTDLDEATCAQLGWERATSLEDALSRAGGASVAKRWGVMEAAAQVLPV